MDSVEIKGLNGRLMYNATTDEITIKHRGLGHVTAPVGQLIGLDLKEPVGPFPGKLRVAVRADTHRGLMPKEPWHFDFSWKDAEAVKTLYYALVARV